MERKTFRGLMTLKENGQAGEVEAKFATLNIVDLDNDVTLPGAFSNGEKVRIAHWGHGWDELPVGRGEIYEQGNLALLKGQFFLDTQTGKDHYTTVKNLAELQEWSYGFDILDYKYGKFNGQDVRFLKKLRVIEVSPVMLGAGIDTQTTSIKGTKKALPVHGTATSTGAWDGPANEARVRSGENVAYYRRVFAWQDPEGDPTVKASYKFPHHEVDADGNPGPANIKACQSGCGVLNGGMGGTTIPDADRQGVWDHLARHLRDGNVEPPALKSTKEGRRNSGKDLEQIQAIHDMVCELGAKCAQSNSDGAGEGPPEGETGKNGKPSGQAGPSILSARVAIELMEAGNMD